MHFYRSHVFRFHSCLILFLFSTTLIQRNRISSEHFRSKNRPFCKIWLRCNTKISVFKFFHIEGNKCDGSFMIFEFVTFFILLWYSIQRTQHFLRSFSLLCTSKEKKELKKIKIWSNGSLTSP